MPGRGGKKTGAKAKAPRGMKRAATAAVAALTTTTTSTLRLGREFFDQPCSQLAQALLGKVMVRRLPKTGEILRGTIVESEAYPGGDDKASVSCNGRRTERIEAMYMEPGTAFVYLTYGMYRMMNISSQGDGSACLLRGIEPQEDYDSMHELREYKKPRKEKEETETKTGARTSKNKSKAAAAVPVAVTIDKKKKPLHTYELANGPGKLCTAFGITLQENKLDLATSEDMWLEINPDPKYHEGNFTIATAPRVGIDSTPPEARNQPWRYFIADNFSVSTAKPAQIKKKLKEKEESQAEQA